MAEALLYDGSSALRHRVDAELFGDVLVLSQPDWREEVPVAQLSISDRSPTGLTLLHGDRPGWRLRVAGPVPREFARRFGGRSGYGRWIDKAGLWPAALAFTGVSALVLAVGYFLPTWAAPLVPQSVERAYGEALVGDFGGKYCSGADGRQALAALTAKLDADPASLNIRVVDLPLVNAAALPAGNVMIFNGLLRDVSGPDELAGILAHEIAHVRERHVTAALLREFGVGIFTTAIGGGMAGQVDGFVSLSFTRRAEKEADDGAIARLNRAEVAPAATAAFFRRLKKVETVGMGRFEPAMAYLSSHPLSAEREKKFQAASKGKSYRPALGDAEWKALRGICAEQRSR